MCQGNQRPMKRILLIRLEETPPQTGLNEAAIPEMLIATSFFSTYVALSPYAAAALG
jgi:hypothetical protein